MRRHDQPRLTPGLFGCPLCDQPPPHSHNLGTILNSLYYCADGSRHEWRPRRWRKPVCTRCGEKKKR